jgi:hypothetical protein
LGCDQAQIDSRKSFSSNDLRFLCRELMLSVDKHH